MIRNQKQLTQAKDNLIAFEKEIKNELELLKSNSAHPVEIEMAENMFHAQLEKFKFEIDEYETLIKSNEIDITNIYDFPKAIVKARILSGYSQADLAQRIEIQEQQIQRYESQEYNKANLERVIQIIDALEMKVSIQLKAKTKLLPLLVEGVNQEALSIRKLTARNEHCLMKVGG